MIVRYLLAALVAGLIAGALQTVVQHAKVVPLILEAEKYEGGAPAAHEHTSGLELSIVSKVQAQTATETTPRHRLPRKRKRAACCSASAARPAR